MPTSLNLQHPDLASLRVLQDLIGDAQALARVLERTRNERIRDLIAGGLVSGAVIARTLGITSGRVSQIAQGDVEPVPYQEHYFQVAQAIALAEQEGAGVSFAEAVRMIDAAA